MLTTLQFNDDITTLDLFGGSYEAYIYGAKQVRAHPEFNLRIVDKKTGEEVSVRKCLTPWYIDRGDDGVKYFCFDLPKTATYELSIHQYQGMTGSKVRGLLGTIFLDIPASELRLLIEVVRLKS